ncbi:MAG: ATP-binding cassette domain-containing protein [Pirellulales bacterium]
MLDVRNLTMRFGGLTAVDDLSFVVEPGTIVSLIGPNGAGKTTAFNAISGIYAPTSGEVLFQGRAAIRPVTPWVYIACVLIGLSTAFASLVIFSNVDTLWNSVVLQPDIQDEFRYAATPGSLWNYLFDGGLRVLPRDGRWSVVAPEYTNSSFDRRQVFATVADEATANACAPNSSRRSIARRTSPSIATRSARRPTS